MLTDGFGRKIEYARISVTDLCDLRCRYCMPECGVQKKQHGDILSLEELAEISAALSSLGVKKQRVTGGEPLVRRGLSELLKKMAADENVSEVCLTTNAQRLKENAALLVGAVDRINVSLDTLNEIKYRELTRGGELKSALEGIEEARLVGFKIKLNAVLLKGVNDGEIRELALFAKACNAELRCIELMPFGGQEEYVKQHFISSNDIIKRYDLQKSTNQAPSEKARRFVFPDGLPVSFISPLGDKFCAFCNRVRVTADGKLLNCLHENKEYDLKPFLGDSDKLKNAIVEAVSKKPKEHRMAEGLLQKRPMENIGG